MELTQMVLDFDIRKPMQEHPAASHTNNPMLLTCKINKIVTLSSHDSRNDSNHLGTPKSSHQLRPLIWLCLLMCRLCLLLCRLRHLLCWLCRSSQLCLTPVDA
jgi:hypothetical protein